MNRQKEPLYRKVNTRARNVHHKFGSDAKYDRNSKSGMSEKMKKDVHRGLDYTPLYRFLLSKVGQNFDKIYSEAVSRLDKDDPIWHMVYDPNDIEANRYQSKAGYICSGESSIYSALYVDSLGVLQLVNPDLKNEDFAPNCSCCTHTFNGKPLVKKYNAERPVEECYPK